MRRAGGFKDGRSGRPALWAWTALALPALGIAMLSPAAHGVARFAAAAATLSRQAPRAQPVFTSGSPFEGTPAAGALYGHTIRSLYRAAVAGARGTG
jgi:hypothetical protein